MAGMKRRLGYCAGSAGVVLAGLYMVFTPVFAQNSAGQGAKPPVKIAGDFDKVRILPPGGPAPRTADGHPDLTGRYYPNHAGRMLQGAYRIGCPFKTCRYRHAACCRDSRRPGPELPSSPDVRA